MALDFPSSPTDGQVYGTYTYDSVVGVWRTTPDLASGLPAGTIVQWPGATAPANWMIADGSAISRTTYASLFNAIGTTYGVGDGTTTFNLPNLKGRVVAGLDSSQTEFDSLGETGGAKTHTLTVAEMPSHNHGGSTANAQAWASAAVYASGGSTNFVPHVWGGSYVGSDSTYAAATAHSHTISSQGGGGAHNNLQPYIVLNYIIKLSAGITAGDSELATRVGVAESRLNVSPSSPNYVINGALDYWQRSTSAAQAGNSNGFPSADRIRVISAGGSSPAITLARSTDVPAGIGARYSAAMSWSSNISAGDVILHHGIENGKFLFAGKTITVSFYAKAATAIQSKFDFDQDYNETFFNLTTSWARYSYTVTLPSNYGTSRPATSAQNDNVEMRFIRFTSISSASNTIYFTGLQVEEGSFATAFRRSATSLQAEFASCQRYYQRISGDGVTVGAGAYYIATRAYFSCTMPEMRAVPTITASSQSAVNVFSNANSAVSSSLAFDQAVSSTKTWEFNAITSTRTAGDGAWARINGSAYFEFSAEI